MVIKKRHQLVMTWLQEAKVMIKNKEKEDYQIRQKSSWKDLVTEVDVEVEDYFRQRIQTEFPEDEILAEESATSQLFDDVKNKRINRLWVIDPIDGTLNFIHKHDDYAVMLAYFEDGEAKLAYIMDMNQGDIFYAIQGQGIYKNEDEFYLSNSDFALEDGFISINSKIIYQEKHEGIRQLAQYSQGVRMIGSAGLEALSVLKGDHVAYLSSSLMPWDFAAATLLLSEAGLCYSNFSGEPLNVYESDSVIFAYPRAFRQIHDYLDSNV